LPTKEGFTIRRSELGTFLRALHEANEVFAGDGGEQPPVVRNGRNHDREDATGQQQRPATRDPF
jgi:hypothetical protein